MSLHLQFIVAPSHTVRSKCDKGNCANRGPLSPVRRFQTGKAKFLGNDIQNNETIPMCCVCSVHRSNARCDCPSSVCIQSPRAHHIYIQSVFLCGARSPNLSLDEVCIIQVFFSFFLFFSLFLQLRFSCFHPQNKFSSKIAIKSLWKFMSIVAAIWREKKTIHLLLPRVSSLQATN